MSGGARVRALARKIQDHARAPRSACWRAIAQRARQAKVATGDPDEKNRLWAAHTFAEATLQYLDAYEQMASGRYMDGWCTLEHAEFGFASLAANPFLETLVPIVESRGDLIALWQSLFPYRHFASPGMRYKKWACSICGKQSTPLEPCGHLLNRVYAGEMCYRTILDFEALEISIVTDPVQKYSVLQLDYDYSVVRYVLDHLDGPFHRWSGNWTFKRHDHAHFTNRAPSGPCPCGSDLRYEECCLQTEGVRLPHFQMAAATGTRDRPMEERLILRNSAADSGNQFKVTIAKAG